MCVFTNEKCSRGEEENRQVLLVYIVALARTLKQHMTLLLPAVWKQSKSWAKEEGENHKCENERQYFFAS